MSLNGISMTELLNESTELAKNQLRDMVRCSYEEASIYNFNLCGYEYNNDNLEIILFIEFYNTTNLYTRDTLNDRFNRVEVFVNIKAHTITKIKPVIW